MKERYSELSDSEPEYKVRAGQIDSMIESERAKYRPMDPSAHKAYLSYLYIRRTPLTIREIEFAKHNIDPDALMKSALSMAAHGIKSEYLTKIFEKLKVATQPDNKSYTNVPLSPEQLSSSIKHLFIGYSQEITDAYTRGTNEGVQTILEHFQADTVLLPGLTYKLLQHTPLSKNLVEQMGGKVLDVDTKVKGIYARYLYEYEDPKTTVIKNNPKVSLWVTPLNTSPRR